MPNLTRAPATRVRQRGFFDFSMPELGIIFTIALVVLGPKKLPPLVQQIGRWVGRARQMARQFRDQLEQEVNSINAVKPVSRPAPPDVGPPAPGTAAPPDVQRGSATDAASVVDAGAEEAGAPTGAAHPPDAEPAGSDVHPEEQIYFALNGTQPEVVAYDPHAAQPFTDDSLADDELAHETQAAAAKPAEPAQPTSVEVLFPHDHG